MHRPPALNSVIALRGKGIVLFYIEQTGGTAPAVAHSSVGTTPTADIEFFRAMIRTEMRQGLHRTASGLLVLFSAACEQAATAVTSQPVAVPRYGVFEQTFTLNSGGYANPWEQVTLTMTLTSPSNRQATVGGFFYGPDTWKARFAPDELGDWSWQAVLNDGRASTRSTGRFTVVQSEWPGFIRSNPTNPFRWVFADGTSYNPVGIGDCVLDNDHDGSPLNDWGLDGGFRPAGQETGRTVDIDAYLKAYSQAGVNLFRWSVDNCSFGLYERISPDGNVYRAKEGVVGDTLVRKLRQYGFRTYMVIFGFNPPSDVDAIKRYVNYVVARYGAFVDFWELMNEATASDDWYREVATYLRSIDPYKHPISTSWEKPNLDVIEITSPHWYEKEDEFDSDRVTWDRFTQSTGPDGGLYWKAANKPVIVGEQGNQFQNWDDRSALRMRLRSWTTFFAEGALIFWNGSGAKDYRSLGAATIYLGPEERGYLRVLQDFARGFDANAAIATVVVSDPGRVRAYGLSSPTTYAAYLHAYTNHASLTSGINVTIEPRAAGIAMWIEPVTGHVLASQRISAGHQSLVVPAFVTDIALKIN